MDALLNRPISRRNVLAAAGLAGVGVAAARFVDLEALTRGLSSVPTPAGQWPNALATDAGRVAHLLRRAGFGYSAADFEASIQLRYPNLVEKLLNPGSETVTPPPDLLKIDGLRTWWMTRMVTSPNPLREKMTLFWHGFLTTDYRKLGNKQPHMYNQNVLYRQQGMSNFRSLLQATSRNPAMMLYLDLQTSRKGAPNENYARELMELFTMGPGNYTETDVREAARALTGWTVKDAASVFNPKLHDDGQKTFLGMTGNLGMDDVIDRILAQPANAPFVATKFARYFVTPSPSVGYVRRLAEVLTQSKWDITALLRAIFLSPEFLAPSSYRALVKSPAEFVASALRAVGGDHSVQAGVGQMLAMDQVLFDPPTVAGWPSDGGWITSNTLLGRINFVQDLVTRVKTLPPEAQARKPQLDDSLSPQTALMLGERRGVDSWYTALIATEFQLK